jgi:hypothetical protein
MPMTGPLSLETLKTILWPAVGGGTPLAVPGFHRRRSRMQSSSYHALLSYRAINLPRPPMRANRAQDAFPGLSEYPRGL